MEYQDSQEAKLDVKKLDTKELDTKKLDSKSHWPEAVKTLSERGLAFVLVTIIGVRGSAPRDSGTKMVVTADEIYATIGGGHLEHKAIKRARALIKDGRQDQHIEHFALGPSLGQCCGGSTSLLFEKFSGQAINIILFGAGHVGRALVTILADLPCRIRWVDSREDQFPESMPANTRHTLTDSPIDEIATMPSGSYYLVMSHSHQLDFDLCVNILKRADFAYCGLIGSKTKWARFQKRLQQRLAHHQTYHQTVPSIDEDKKSIESDQRKIKNAINAINGINCPIGLSAVPGKRPMEVAVSIAAEIIQHYQIKQSKQSKKSPASVQQGVPWQALATLADKLSLGES